MAPLSLGEGARWLPQGPVQVDLLGGRLLLHRETGTTVLVDLDVPLGAVAPMAGGGLVLVAGTGVLLVPEEGIHARVDTGEDPAVVRVNDATTDAQGRLWFGTMRHDEAAGGGALWRLDPDLTLTRVLSELSIPNGPVVDATRDALYLSDSAEGVIRRHALDPRSGRLAPGERFAVVDDASPDGMALDADGGVWSAQFGGARLHRYGADGELTDVVPLPVSQPTSVALAPDGGRALVTSARRGLAEPGGLDGRSLWVELGAAGPAARAFGPLA